LASKIPNLNKLLFEILLNEAHRSVPSHLIASSHRDLIQETEMS